MILFLDDDSNRAALAYQRMSKEDRERVIWCQTAEEAIVTLNDYSNKLEKAMLDHDLGGEHYVNTKRNDCGMEVVRFLEKLSEDNPKKFSNLKNTIFIIHTWNEHAGPVMVERLSKLGLKVEYRPFGL